MKIEGAVALVTGSNRGIGAAIVEALLTAGVSRVYAAARTSSGAVRDRVMPITLDVTDAVQVANAGRRCADVQILINNAGVLTGEPLVRAKDPGAAEQEMRVNYFGTLAMCRAFAPILGRNGGGAIVNVLSTTALVSVPIIGSYAASKAAAYSLTQGIRGELASQGTLVVGVVPGFVDTDMVAHVSVPGKLAPSAVASTVVDALLNGTEDAYPGDAIEIANGVRSDPKAFERRFASFSLPH